MRWSARSVTVTATATRVRSASCRPFEACRSRMARRGICRARVDAGQRAGDIKPAHLDDRLDWSLVFEGAPANHSFLPRSHDEHRWRAGSRARRDGSCPGRQDARTMRPPQGSVVCRRAIDRADVRTAARAGHPRAAPRALAIAGGRPWRWKTVAHIATPRCRRVTSSTASSAARITAGSTTTRDAASRCPRGADAAPPHCGVPPLPGRRAAWPGLGVDGRRRAGGEPFPMPYWDSPGWGTYYMVTAVSERGDAPGRELHGCAAYDFRACRLVPAASAQAHSCHRRTDAG